MSSYTEQKTCRVCGYPVETVLDFGEIYPSAFPDPEIPLSQFSKAPLALAKCTNRHCGLVQLAHTVDLDSMYFQYYYQSGINPSMVAALKDVVDEATKLVMLEDGDVVVDIAANDFTLLANYPLGVYTVGFDPARNLPRRTEIDWFINDYFSAAAYPAIPKAKIVTSIAMFYDLPQPMKFVLDVKTILDDDGIWVMQINDLKSMIELNAFDAVCFEHLEYYSIDDIMGLMLPAGLQVFRIEHNDVNGGSLRFYICHRGNRPVQDNVTDFWFRDRDYLNSPKGTISAFAERVEKARDTLMCWLRWEKDNDGVVYGLAASTKGNTLLQYYGIDSTLITAIADKNPDKFGKVTIGTGIPIMAESEALGNNPDAFVVLAWGFLPFFLDKMKDYLHYQGSMLIAPLPEPTAYFWDYKEERITSLSLEELLVDLKDV